MRILKTLGWILVGTAAVAAFGLALGVAVMLLWNWLLPALFGFPEITYWQAVGLFVLCHLLFKGPSTDGGRRSGDGDRGKTRSRERFVSRLKNRFPNPPEAADAAESAGDQ